MNSVEVKKIRFFFQIKNPATNTRVLKMFFKLEEKILCSSDPKMNLTKKNTKRNYLKIQFEFKVQYRFLQVLTNPPSFINHPLRNVFLKSKKKSI